MQKEKKHYPAEEKVAILRRHLIEQVPVSELCDNRGPQPTVLDSWQEEFFERGAAVRLNRAAGYIKPKDMLAGRQQVIHAETDRKTWCTGRDCGEASYVAANAQDHRQWEQMWRKIKRAVRAVWMVAGVAFTAWLYLGFQAAGVPDSALKSDQRVAVVKKDERGLDFRPTRGAQGPGLVFQPGGMVDPVAYAPLLKRIADAGYRAHLTYLPMRCACTDSQTEELFSEIQAIIAAEPRTAWILAGHSRGGMLAARFVHERAPRLAGLVLIGTTHPRDFSLAGTTIPVTKIYGTRDGIATYGAMERNKHLLPPNTSWVEIAGGNHVQFGYYRHQLGDDEAAIPLEDQQRAVEIALLNLLARPK